MKKLILWFQIRSMEITLDGQSLALELVRDAETINRIIIAQIATRKEWHRLRGEYLTLQMDNKWRIAA
jgi:hypothetical protein